MTKQTSDVRNLWLDLSTLVGDEILPNHHENHIIIRNRLEAAGLDADQIKESLGVSEDISLNSMLLNMPTRKSAYLSEYSKYLHYSTTYCDLLFKFNEINTNRKWRFKRFVSKQRVILLI